MPVFALYNFDDADTVLDDAPINGAQNGIYLNGATASGGQLVLDGQNDFAKIAASPEFQMERGTLEINFRPSETPVDHPQTVLSRDSMGQEQGSFRLEVLPDGSIVVTHETEGGETVFSTEPGFFQPGDQINLTYSWDSAGDGGRMLLENQSAGTSESMDVPPGLTMNMGDLSQNWFVGAGQSNSDPALLNNVDGHFLGSVEFFSLSDTVDNLIDGPVANPDTAETPEDTPVVIDVLDNDSAPGGLSITGTPTAQHGTVVVNEDGTLTYTPEPDYHGPDTITYSVTDPSGGTASSTVAVTVTPVNDEPVAEDDTASTTVNTAVVIPVLNNDSDVDGDSLSIVGTPTSEQGVVTVNPDGTLTFTPNTDFVGDALLNYEITDGNGGSDTASVVVTVIDPAAGPVRDGIVRGTDQGDLIDRDYIDPWDIDRVDANDAILGDDAPNDDRIEAGAGNDTIYAVNGDDTIRAGDGDDLAYGGSGNDEIYGGAGSDTLYGGRGDDVLFGGSGDDSLTGNRGDDTITSGSGSDTVYGHQGDDVIDTTGGGQSPDRGYPGVYEADANPDDARDLVYGGQGNDIITTGDDADTIYGGAGNDMIDAGVDADLVYGGQGNDTIIGSEGSDTIYGEMGDDLIYGGLGPVGGDVLDITDDLDLDPDNNRDLIYGGQGNDTIYGRDDDDTLHGGAGNDLIYGGVDDDVVYGDRGNDTLYGEHGNDTLNGGADDDLIYGGIGDDRLSGDRGNDALYGGEGNDVAYGGAGNDTLYGGAGTDSLYGGGDRDLFIVGSQEDGIGDFIDGNENGDDFDVLDLSGSGPLRIVYDADNVENGIVHFLDDDGNETGTLRFINIENVIPCFTPGALIATPRGEVPVETLREGDKVITRDNGIQEIRWVGQRALTGQELRLNSHLNPILIKRGSLGNDLPEQDMLVSPNHRMLVANDRTQLYFEEHEVLVAAKHLVGSQGVQAINSIGVTYIHFMFDRHEVVLSGGAWTESFQPGDMTLKGMGNAQRNEIFELFPELKTDKGLEDYQAARRTLKRHEARLLVK
ncbi:Hint domain-containing protein [Xinfangfangia sp. CPCC 101601]|uniref:Hint domain-containing protein n=1 Tax=Pseudogemmobacter lacusdianii TaxID=3069608 RepID=A0ABU0VV81_9RHOB|nr:Hint domain-containing protein [Xinfangfangia sp. CPCC 101601]MDQ2065637.1 Hint domain-containing protein [Xinfangfangia sp. CPCC 101601]